MSTRAYSPSECDRIMCQVIERYAKLSREEKAELANRLAGDTCVWSYTDVCYGECWHTECGRRYNLGASAVASGRFVYCPACGRAIREEGAHEH